MEGGAVGLNFEMGLPKDYPSQIWFNLVLRFQRRRFKCESLRRTTDAKSSHGHWPGELIKSYNVLNYNNCSTDWSFPLTENNNSC